MEENIIDLAYDLKDTIKNSNLNKELEEAESKMEENEEVMALSYRYSVAQTEYSDVLKIYKMDSLEAKKAQHKLYMAKKELEEHPIVRIYLEKYAEVRKCYDEIDAKIFNKFREHICEHKFDLEQED